MSNWVAGAADLLLPLVDVLAERVLHAAVGIRPVNPCSVDGHCG
jgi:hypothetical protein